MKRIFPPIFCLFLQRMLRFKLRSGAKSGAISAMKGCRHGFADSCCIETTVFRKNPLVETQSPDCCWLAIHAGLCLTSPSIIKRLRIRALHTAICLGDDSRLEFNHSNETYHPRHPATIFSITLFATRLFSNLKDTKIFTSVRISVGIVNDIRLS